MKSRVELFVILSLLLSVQPLQAKPAGGSGSGSSHNQNANHGNVHSTPVNNPPREAANPNPNNPPHNVINQDQGANPNPVNNQNQVQNINNVGEVGGPSVEHHLPPTGATDKPSPQIHGVIPDVDNIHNAGGASPQLPLGPGKLSKPKVDYPMPDAQQIAVPDLQPQLGPGKLSKPKVDYPTPDAQQIAVPDLQPQLGPGKLSKPKVDYPTPDVQQIAVPDLQPQLGPGKLPKPKVDYPTPDTQQIAVPDLKPQLDPGKLSKPKVDQATPDVQQIAAPDLKPQLRPTGSNLPGGVQPHQIGHASIFQHAHSTTDNASKPQIAQTTGRIKILPQVTHGVSTKSPNIAIRDQRVFDTSSGYCVTTSEKARKAVTAFTKSHFVQQTGGASFSDPVSRSVPAHQNGYLSCLSWVLK